jgi:hypothetical protein
MAEQNQGTRRHTQSSVLRGLVIQGNLEETPLPETVQFLLNLKKTGILALERAGSRQAASIGFIDGQVVHASAPPLSGEACLLSLLTWREGRYVFMPNQQPRERSINRDTGALLLDGLRLLDELSHSSELLPPRGTVLYRRRSPESLRQASLSFHHYRLWRRLDGRSTIGELVDADPTVAALLADLIRTDLATPSPDYRFMERIVLAQTAAGAGQADHDASELAGRLLVLANGRRTLADLRADLGCHAEDALTAAEYLIALRLVVVKAGGEDAELLA